jgi:hypothetical protein
LEGGIFGVPKILSQHFLFHSFGIMNLYSPAMDKKKGADETFIRLQINWTTTILFISQ